MAKIVNKIKGHTYLYEVTWDSQKKKLGLEISRKDTKKRF